MPTLAEVRKAHPEYADLNDQQLADGLYKRFYSDMPRAQFNAKVGFGGAAPKPPVAAWVDAHVAHDQGLIGQAYRYMRADQDAKMARHDQRAATPAPAFGSFGQYWGGELKSAASAGAGMLQDFRESMTGMGEGPHRAPQAPVQSLMRAPTAVGMIATAPVAAATHGVVVRPLATIASKTGVANYQDAEDVINTGLMGLGPEGKFAGGMAPLRAARAARVATAPGRATPLADTVAQFDRAGVRPSLAAATGRDTAPLAKAVSENAIAGVRARQHMAGQIGDVQAAATRQANAYGTPLTRQGAAQTIKGGVEAFANGDGPQSFSTRAGELYDKAFSDLDTAMAGKQSPRTVTPIQQDIGPGAFRVGPGGEVAPAQVRVGTMVEGGSKITTTAAQSALHDMTTGAVQSKPIADLIADPTLKRVAGALREGTGDMSFQDLRRLRTWVREAQKNTDLRQNIGSANLQRLEGALTSDIYTNAEKLGSPQMLHQLKRADDYYAAGMTRLNDRLGAVFKTKSDESAYDLVQRAAQDQGGADIARLTALKRSLGPDWGDVAATMAQRLGKVRPGAPNALEDEPFSINNFVTNYASLSEAGRDTLFGARAGGGAKAARLRKELDNLAQVAAKVKGVEAAANNSKSGVSMQNLASLGGLANPHTMIPTATGLGGMALTGEVLTNPAAVRLLARMTQARSPAQAAAVKSQITALATRQPKLAAQLLRHWSSVSPAADYTSLTTTSPGSPQGSQ